MANNAFFNRASAANDLTQWAFAFRASMAEIRTVIPVKVIAVHGGGLAPVGRVDVQPLVQQTDSAGNVMSLPVLYGLPYLRWQGGVSAVILDPVAGDIGLACFADRDVSAVVATGKLSPPGSNRRFSLADGFYVGATLNAVPTQYIQFLPNGGGINVVSPAGANINGNVMVNGNLGSTNGASGVITTLTGQTVTFVNGICVNIF